MLYGISDLDAILDSSVEFPLAEAYIQATSSKSATLGLLLIIVLAGLLALQAFYAMVSEAHQILHGQGLLKSIVRSSPLGFGSR